MLLMHICQLFFLIVDSLVLSKVIISGYIFTEFDTTYMVLVLSWVLFLEFFVYVLHFINVRFVGLTSN